MIVSEIIYNLSLLALLSVLSNFLDDRLDRHELRGQASQGLLFGLIAITGMIYPFTYAEGIIFDGRTVVVSLGTAFFGPLAGAISMMLAGTFRVYIGGDGATMGMLTLIFAYIIGWVFHLFKKKNLNERITTFQLLSMGVIVHFMMAVFVYTLPSQHVTIVLQTIAITVMGIYPLVTLLIGKILTAHEERRMHMQKLEESEERFRRLIHSSDDIIFTLNNSLFHTGVYGKWMEPLGKKAEDYLGKTVIEIHGKKLGEYQEEQFRKALRGHDVVYEWEDERPDGVVHFQTKVSPMRREDGQIIGLVGIARDITDTRKLQLQLKRSLKEKNILIAEIHHRVKNNMAIISSLLNLQSGYAGGHETRDLLLETESRVRAMALVHELVYEGDNFTEMDMRDLLQRLVNLLSRSFEQPGRNITTSLEADDITMDMSSSIPMALLVNELVTNAWKHGFRNGNDGNIHVSFQRNDGHFVLNVSDTGSGMSDQQLRKLERPSSFGYTIIHGLVQQLNGTIQYESPNGGLNVSIRF